LIWQNPIRFSFDYLVLNPVATGPDVLELPGARLFKELRKKVNLKGDLSDISIHVDWFIKEVRNSPDRERDHA
jgi:hypothetical protein